ncbi:hypothetical protein CON65_05475 [Bacillus pseudomycoides]|uniref:Uncharacterized protein n=1 Tax=Bacillus pseudomycoides TaxID=64104 RepID=A0AA91VEY6_9BACI|nr:hypothetical protein COO03_15725 [Bacillus sp. AFS098217]PED83674.1 hypothetical protein CON65_05475 [Bacillus pseudomycoides]PEU12338.1 hypothetical protein CN524_13125 [Bacillus sp. AFS019443]PEU21698.1 hypothetical protein CN525_01260 [Bacillus sp. AFS014408]PFW62059.1 hypothetical protein COL20_14500 [Bacillus sp. AFS075034]
MPALQATSGYRFISMKVVPRNKDRFVLFKDGSVFFIWLFIAGSASLVRCFLLQIARSRRIFCFI